MARGGCAPVAAASGWELLPFPSSALYCRRCGKGAQKPSAACRGLIHLLLIVKVEFVPYQTAGSCCKTWPSSRQGWGLAPRSDAPGDAAELEKPLGFGFPLRCSLPLLRSAVPRAGPGGTKLGSGAGTKLPPAPAPSPPPPSPQPPGHDVRSAFAPALGCSPGSSSILTKCLPRGQGRGGSCWLPPGEAGSGLAAGRRGRVLCLPPTRERARRSPTRAQTQQCPAGQEGVVYSLAF